MGRRNINTTKSGKFMNPTDQARKEARKRELKKNKKQRMLVRTAVLKGKDPSEIFLELEKIDLMEFNPDQPPPLNDKVLKEKRKKLKETLERVYKLYEKDDQEFFLRMKKMEGDYVKRRDQIVAYRDAVRTAQHVQIVDIPLPNAGGNKLEPDGAQAFHPSHAHFGGYQVPHVFYPSYAPIPIPSAPAQGILKKTSSFALEALKAKKPPGVPMGPPPILSDIWMDEEEVEETAENKVEEEEEEESSDEDIDGEPSKEEGEEPPAKKTTTLQEKMLQLAGEDIDLFMKDFEDAQKKKDTKKRRDKEKEEEKEEKEEPVVHPMPSMPLRPPGPPPGLPPSLMARPMIPRPGMQPMRPPPPMRLPLRMPGMPMPPGPPPGLPMRMMRPMMPPGMIPHDVALIPPPAGQPMPHSVLTAAPKIVKRGRETTEQTSATIEGKPQIRSLAAEVTRFVPIQLRLKKDQMKLSREVSIVAKPEPPKSTPLQQPTKEDAYYQFMKEMTGLL